MKKTPRNKLSQAALDAAFAIWKAEDCVTIQSVVEMARKIDEAFAKEKKP